MLRILFTLLTVCLALSGMSASDPDPRSRKGDFVVLNEVRLEGNLKTKDRIILRELDMAPGDTIYADEEELRLRKDRNKIVNTNLFVSVEVVLQRIKSATPLTGSREATSGQDGSLAAEEPVVPRRADLVIKVSERWYLFPVPIFELADRNFNEWWYERGRDLSRTQYGLRLTHKNFRGRNEQLSTLAQFGFTRKFELFYDIPYIDQAQKTGLGLGFSFSENKSVAYRTEDHKLEYLDGDNLLRKRFYASVGLTRRNRFYITHELEMKFYYNTIADTIARLNPDYFLHGRTAQRYFQFSYSFVRDVRDAVAYPLHGSRLAFGIGKIGLLPSDDINQLEMLGSYAKYTPLGKKFYFNNRFQAKLSLPGRQPYANTRGLGYGQDFVRGYELYVIDGQSYLMSKSTLKREIFKTQKNIKKIISLRQFQTVPIAMYINLYFDMGYVADRNYYSENKRFTNVPIYGTGLGLDLVTFYNTVFRVDFSLNKSMEKNFFIHFVKDI